MQKTLIVIWILSLVIIWGCFKNNNIIPSDIHQVENTKDNISQEAQVEADKRVTGNETCDKYLATIKCIADKGWSDNEFSMNYNSIISSFTDIPVEQLQETCTTLTTSLQEHPTLLIYNSECNMINIHQEQSANSSWDNTTLDAVIQ